MVGTAILLTLKEQKGWVHDFGIFVEGNQFTYPALSLLINIFATSIIALKAWCVHVHGVFRIQFLGCALIDDMMRMYIQEIPQVADGKRDDPNPYRRNEDFSPPS